MSAAPELPAFFTLVFPWTFIGIGLVQLIRATQAAIRAAGCGRWPVVEGRVISAKLVLNDSIGDGPAVLYTPHVEYRYTIDGVTRTSSRLALIDFDPGSEKRAEAVLKRYKVGRVLCVRVSPSDPTLSVLEPGLRWPHWRGLALGFVSAAAGLGMLIFFGAKNG